MNFEWWQILRLLSRSGLCGPRRDSPRAHARVRVGSVLGAPTPIPRVTSAPRFAAGRIAGVSKAARRGRLRATCDAT